MTLNTVTSEDSAAISLHRPEARLKNELSALPGVRYVTCVRVEDVLLEDVLLVQVRGGELLDVARVLHAADLGPYDFHHTV